MPHAPGALRSSVRASLPACSLAAALAFTVHPAAGAISQSTLIPPGGYVQAASYSISNGLVVPGGDLGSASTPQSFEEHAFAGNSSAAASAAYNGSPTVNSVTASAGLGVFRALAVNSTISTESFPAAAANGGWKETFTVNNAAHTGQPGFMTFQVRARGSEHATGVSGSAFLILAPYKDNTRLSTNPYFSAGNSDLIATTNQYGQWGIATFGNPNSDSRIIDGVVTFSVPITFGQPFTLGVYALAAAGLRSSGGFGTTCTGRADFSGPGVTWNGISGILSESGSPVAGSTIVSGSGLDWSGPYNTCIADVDDGTATGTRDGGVTIDDLLYYLQLFQDGLVQADVDDGSNTGTPDGGVTIDDLLYYLLRFEAGC